MTMGEKILYCVKEEFKKLWSSSRSTHCKLKAAVSLRRRLNCFWFGDAHATTFTIVVTEGEKLEAGTCLITTEILDSQPKLRLVASGYAHREMGYRLDRKTLLAQDGAALNYLMWTMKVQESFLVLHFCFLLPRPSFLFTCRQLQPDLCPPAWCGLSVVDFDVSLSAITRSQASHLIVLMTSWLLCVFSDVSAHELTGNFAQWFLRHYLICEEATLWSSFNVCENSKLSHQLHPRCSFLPLCTMVISLYRKACGREMRWKSCDMSGNNAFIVTGDVRIKEQDDYQWGCEKQLDSALWLCVQSSVYHPLNLHRQSWNKNVYHLRVQPMYRHT